MIYEERKNFMNIDLCKGCISYSGQTDLCHLIDKYSHKVEKSRIQCPCVECLIKSICISGCRPRSDFADSVIDVPKDYIRLKRNNFTRD